MERADERRKELGALLRKRREQLRRDDFALPTIGRGRTIGLRREEIAALAGVSVTWYTWLEQGREINPSRQVLDAIANTLRLAPVEHEYVLALAGLPPMPPADVRFPAEVPGHLQRLLDAQLPAPAFAVSPDWTIGGWNRAYQVLYPNVARVAAEQRNLLVLIFTDPHVRRMLPDWELTSRQFLAEYRAEAGALLGHPAHVALVDRLRQESPDFAEAWEQYEIGRFASRERRFRHPEVGELIFEQHRLIPADVPDLQLVIYLPTIETAAHLTELLRDTPPDR